MKIVPEFRLHPEPATEDAKRVLRPPYVAPEVGTRHKLSGVPEGPRVDPFPKCTSCAGEMTVYGLLDGIPGAVDLADAGLVHVFVVLAASLPRRTWCLGREG